MDRVKHMILIDPESKKTTNNSIQQRVNNSIRIREIQSLDKNLQDIINNDTLTDDAKVTFYNQTFSKFRDLYKKKDLPVEPIETVGLKQNSSNVMSDQLFLAPIPKLYQNKARNLLNFLRSKAGFNIGENGDLSINGQGLSESNITDLLNKAVNPRNKLREDLAGWDTFKSYLQEN